MEATRVSSFHSFPCFSGAGFDDTLSSKTSFSSSVFVKNAGGEIKLVSHGDRRKSCVVSSNLQFSDGGHLQYYQSPPKAGLKEKEKKKDSEKKDLKKKLKLIKGMSKDLLKFSSMGFGVEAHDGLISEIKEKKISEATEILLAQLKQLKAEEKELKRKKKEEKAKLKAESSSSSSSSSDSECGEVVNMTSLRAIAVSEPVIDEPQLKIEIPSLPLMGVEIQDQREEENAPNTQNVQNDQAQTSTSCRSEGSVVMVGASTEKIEVCMGGKCKKSGATALLEEFQERVGVEGVVVGCKCMGKCRDGPNVRIVNQCSSDDGDVRPPQTSPLCIGVGLEDVGVILGNFLGEERKDLGLMVA